MNKFWLNNPLVLFQEIPDNLEFVDKLNLIFLVSLVISIILVLINNFDLSYLMLAIVVGIITFILYQHKYIHKVEDFKNRCIEPSNDNPFMNPSHFNDSYAPPCDTDNKILNDMFYADTFRDVNDFYERGLSIRQFYSVPASTIPNDRDTLAKWLYNSNNNKTSCKQGNYTRCIENIGLDRTDTRKTGI